MTKSLLRKDRYLRPIFDIILSALFVVDQDFKILDLNPAAAEMFGIDSGVNLNRICGQFFHCLHAIKSEEGCGATMHCSDCAIRKSVESSFEGKLVKKSKHKMRVFKDNDLADIWMLVSTSPFEYENDKLVFVGNRGH